MSIEQRQAIANGIWCCADHGRLIDTNRGYKFPAELLKHWKALHEGRIAREMGGSSTQAPEWAGWAAVEIQDIGPGRNEIVELKP